MGEHRHPPNRRLAWERLQHGWSYEEVADRIRAEMQRAEETDTGLSANTVRRWETGERWPDPRYRKHLVTIFGRTASGLGLLTREELSQRPDGEVLDEFRRLCEVVLRGPDDGGVDRATVLRGLIGTGMLPLLSPLLSLQGDESEPVEGSVSDPESYASIARCHRELYWTSPARPLFEATYAHTQLGVLLKRRAESRTRTAFATALAESALLTARLAFFDLGQPAIADRCFDVALAATREAGDHALAAAVLGHMAFVPGFSNEPATARDLIAAALQHTWHGVSPTVRSWLHCVASEVEGRAGAGATSRHHVDLAETALQGGQLAPEWLDFYSAARLDCFAGYAATVSGDREEAVDRLSRALKNLGDNGGKQRSIVLADLASASAEDGDQATHYLHSALAALEADWYGTGLARIREARRSLRDSEHGRQLDQRIETLVASRPALS
jgi:transcriptional regulator with XRE-family HTH domain/tetratricopeptide (TPR) repeat protein